MSLVGVDENVTLIHLAFVTLFSRYDYLQLLETRTQRVFEVVLRHTRPPPGSTQLGGLVF